MLNKFVLDHVTRPCLGHVLYVLFCILVYVLFYFYFTIACVCTGVCVLCVFVWTSVSDLHKD